MTRRLFTLTTLVALLLAGPSLLAAGEPHHVVVHKADCESEDCEHQVRKIFISEDGEATELGGMDLEWVHQLEASLHRASEPHGFLGVQFNEMTPELRRHFGTPEDAGVMVSKVVEGSPAQQAGVQVGDIITRVDGQDIAAGRELARAVRTQEGGTVVQLEIWRADRVQNLSVTLESRQPKQWMHHGGAHDGEHRMVVVECDDEGGDCGIAHDRFSGLHEHCADAGGECEVRVECQEEGCECSVNGEAVDCPHGMGE